MYDSTPYPYSSTGLLCRLKYTIIHPTFKLGRCGKCTIVHPTFILGGKCTIVHPTFLLGMCGKCTIVPYLYTR